MKPFRRFRPRHAVALGVLSVLGLTAASAAWQGHHGGWHDGWGKRGGLDHVCGPERQERIEEMLGFVESFMRFTPEQRPAWDSLAAALRDTGTTLDGACAEIKTETGEDLQAPERLGHVERMLTAGLDVVQQVRPAFERFYAALDPQQQEALDALLAHRHRH